MGSVAILRFSLEWSKRTSNLTLGLLTQNYRGIAVLRQVAPKLSEDSKYCRLCHNEPSKLLTVARCCWANSKNKKSISGTRSDAYFSITCNEFLFLTERVVRTGLIFLHSLTMLTSQDDNQVTADNECLHVKTALLHSPSLSMKLRWYYSLLS